jgi:hypothetical protein
MFTLTFGLNPAQSCSQKQQDKKIVLSESDQSKWITTKYTKTQKALWPNI